MLSCTMTVYTPQKNALSDRRKFVDTSVQQVEKGSDLHQLQIPSNSRIREQYYNKPEFELANNNTTAAQNKIKNITKA